MVSKGDLSVIWCSFIRYLKGDIEGTFTPNLMGTTQHKWTQVSQRKEELSSPLSWSVDLLGEVQIQARKPRSPSSKERSSIMHLDDSFPIFFFCGTS